MVATTGLPSGAALATAKKAAAAKAAAAKKPRAKPTHPRTSDMVDAAIAALKERGGSSLQAIKKYIAASYKLDAEKLSPFIKKYLKSGVVAKKLVQTKGKGASGSFKLSLGDAAGGAAKLKKPSRPAKRPAVAAKKLVAKKSSSPPAKPKKSPLKKKAGSPKKSLAAKPPKPKATKKKSPAKKPAASKAKKAAPRKPVAKK